MTRAEFDLGIERLKQVYGVAKYPGSRIDAMWDKLNEVTGEEYMTVVKTFIACSNNAPLLQEFEICLKGPLDRVAKLKKENVEKTFTECVRCDNKGILFVKRKNEKLGQTYEYVYKCTCARGEALYPTYPSTSTLRSLQ